VTCSCFPAKGSCAGLLRRAASQTLSCCVQFRRVPVTSPWNIGRPARQAMNWIFREVFSRAQVESPFREMSSLCRGCDLVHPSDSQGLLVSSGEVVSAGSRALDVPRRLS